jgi:hypothetical protein
LPAELRNRIAELVLHHGTVHVEGYGFHRGGLFDVSVCTLDHSEVLTKSAPDYRDVRRRHKSCLNDSRLFRTQRFSTNLLKTCRQLNSEMKLVPFAENTFMFHLGYDIHYEGFVRRLTEAQRKAMTSISIVADCRCCALNNTSVACLTDLSSVKFLTIHVRECPSRREVARDLGYRLGPPDLSRVHEAFIDLARLPLKSASVICWLRKSMDDKCRAFAAGLETHLVRPWAEIEAETNKETEEAERRKKEGDAILELERWKLFREGWKLFREGSKLFREWWKLLCKGWKHLVGDN